jgi:TorA maturation chaperone TorD
MRESNCANSTHHFRTDDHLGRFGEPADPAAQQRFFDRHLASWAGRFFADLERAEHALLYRPVGTVGRLFLGIEAEAFALAG